ncbi:hypothetical protein Tco_1027943 [Tanacetum coccineum]
MLDQKDVIFTLDLFCFALKLSNENDHNLFILLADFPIIREFLKILGYEGPVLRLTTFYVKNLTQPWQTLFKYPLVLKRLNEPYNTVKDDTPLLMMLTTRESEKEIALEEGEANSWESSDPKKSLKFMIKQRQPGPSIRIPTINDIERVERSILAEDVEKLKEGDEVFDEVFTDSMIISQEDPGTRLEPGSYKENLKEIDDDEDDDDDENDNDDHNDHGLIKIRKTGSSKVRNKKMHTPITSPHRSNRNDLSLNMALMQKLPKSNVSMIDVPSQSTSSHNKCLKGIVARMMRRQGHMMHNMRNSFVQKSYVRELHIRVDKSLEEVVHKMVTTTANYLMKENLPGL